MRDKEPKFDANDRAILAELQRDGALSQRELAGRIGLSQNACWRRVTRLRETGALGAASARIDPQALGLGLTVFVLVRTRTHSGDWSQCFRRRCEAIADVVELHRIGGEWDYLLKVVTDGMGGYDRVYRRLTDGLELETVTGLFSMETMLADRPLTPPG